MAEEKVLYSVEEGVALITLNRPKQRNAQDYELLVQLDAAWSQAAADKAVRVIILNANGPHFSAGHDITPEALGQADVDWSKEGLADLYHEETKHYLGYCRKWRNIPKPSIAAVQGACIAGGLMLAWPCDLIVAADNAKFSDPVVYMGIGGVEYHMHTWELGARKAKEMLFTCSSLDAQEAKDLGMVSRVVPVESLLDEAMTLAKDIAKKPAFGLAMAKRAVNRTLDIMGQDNAIEAVFDMHHLGHGNAMAATGMPAFVDLGGMKKANKKET